MFFIPCCSSSSGLRELYLKFIFKSFFTTNGNPVVIPVPLSLSAKLILMHVSIWVQLSLWVIIFSLFLVGHQSHWLKAAAVAFSPATCVGPGASFNPQCIVTTSLKRNLFDAVVQHMTQTSTAPGSEWTRGWPTTKNNTTLWVVLFLSGLFYSSGQICHGHQALA